MKYLINTKDTELIYWNIEVRKEIKKCDQVKITIIDT